MLLLNLLTLAAVCMYFSPQQITLDFSQSRNLAVVGWPEDYKLDQYARQGKIDLTLILEPGRVYKSRVETIFFLRNGCLLKQVKAAGEPMTRADAVARFKELGAEWGFTTAHVAEWERETDKGSLNSVMNCVRAKGPQPEVCVSIYPSFNAERPWYIMFEVYWAS